MIVNEANLQDSQYLYLVQSTPFLVQCCPSIRSSNSTVVAEEFLHAGLVLSLISFTYLAKRDGRLVGNVLGNFHVVIKCETTGYTEFRDPRMATDSYCSFGNHPFLRHFNVVMYEVVVQPMRKSVTNHAVFAVDTAIHGQDFG